MSNEKLGAEQGRGTLQAIAQEIVANLGSCDASSDLGFKVIWATLDRHFGTGPKQTEQANHARGAGREAHLTQEQVKEIIAPYINLFQFRDCFEIVTDRLNAALREPGADTGTRERLDEARWWHARIGLNHGMKWCCERIEELERAAADTGTTPPTFEMQTWKHVQRLTDLVRHQRSELHEAGLISDYEYERLAEDHGAVKRLEDYDGAIRAAAERGTTPPEALESALRGVMPFMRYQSVFDYDAYQAAIAEASHVLAQREPGADTGTTGAEGLSGMLAERMIKLAIKIQGPYATFGPPESLERRKKSHQERIEELTGMLTTEFAECLERGTTPPQCPYDRRTCDEVRATLGPETDRMRQEQLKMASACQSAQAGSDTPASRERLDEARWWHARIGLNHGMKWCCERIEELERGR